MAGKDELVDQGGRRERRDAAGDRDGAELAAAVTSLALDLLPHLGAGGNLVLSPASLASALAMLAPGARGDTAAEILALLGGARPAEWLARTAGELERRMAAPVGLGPPHGHGDDARQPTFVLRITNDLWAQHGLPFRPAFLALLDAAFRTSAHGVDFEAAPQQARRQINDAIAERTGGKIPELLAQGHVGRRTRLVLTNAVYLEASWVTPFEPSETTEAPFHLPSGATMAVETMRRQGQMAYAQAAGWRALRLDYVGGRLAMLLLLPDGPPSDRPERTLTTELLADLRRGLRHREVRVSLPRLDLRGALDLNRPLERLGMRQAFTERADFGAMVEPGTPLRVDQILQQAVVSIDEHGTVAAAATAIAMRTVAFREPEEPVELRFDRPFLFMVLERASGYPLFLGRVTEPRA